MTTDSYGLWCPGQEINPAGLTDDEKVVLTEAVNIIKLQWLNSDLDLLKMKAATLDRASIKVGISEEGR